MVADTLTNNYTPPLDQRGKDGSAGVVVASTAGMVAVCMLLVVSLSTTVCLFVIEGGVFRYAPLGTTVLLLPAALASPIYRRRVLKCLLSFLLLSIGTVQAVLLAIFSEAGSAAVFALGVVSVATAVLASAVVLLLPPYVKPGSRAHHHAHTRNKPSWSSSLRSTRRQSIIDFSGYDSVASTPTTKLAPNDASGRTEGTTSPFWVQALYEFAGANRNELSFKKGERLLVTDYRGNWWRARKESAVEGESVEAGTNQVCNGFIPSNFIQVLRKARVMPAASQKRKGRRRRHSLDGMDNTAYLPVLPGQIVEVLDSTPFSTTILESSDDHIDGISEEIECWVVRGVDARVGRVPKAWLELLGEHQGGTGKTEANEEACEAFEDAIEK